jgi:hypothetical protein
MNYRVRDAIGAYAVTLADGEIVYHSIHPELRAGRPVQLDFADVEVFASPFFNAAVGTLLKDISAEDLNDLLGIANLSPAGTHVLRRVIENAKQYYQDATVRRAVDAMLEERAKAV